MPEYLWFRSTIHRLGSPYNNLAMLVDGNFLYTSHGVLVVLAISGLQWIKKKSTTGIMRDTVEVMAELRVSIKNNFAESHLLFNHLSHTAQMKLGSMPVGKYHAVAPCSLMCMPCAMVVEFSRSRDIILSYPLRNTSVLNEISVAQSGSAKLGVKTRSWRWNSSGSTSLLIFVHIPLSSSRLK